MSRHARRCNAYFTNRTSPSPRLYHVVYKKHSPATCNSVVVSIRKSPSVNTFITCNFQKLCIIPQDALILRNAVSLHLILVPLPSRDRKSRNCGGFEYSLERFVKWLKDHRFFTLRFEYVGTTAQKSGIGERVPR